MPLAGVFIDLTAMKKIASYVPNRSTIRPFLQPPHHPTHHGQLFVDFLGWVPVVAVGGDFALRVQQQMCAAAHGLFGGFVEVFEVELEFPDQKAGRAVDKLAGDDEAGGVQRFKHVAVDVLNGGQAAHVVEGVFEGGVRRVELGHAGDALRGDGLEEGDDVGDGGFCHHNFYIINP